MYSAPGPPSSHSPSPGHPHVLSHFRLVNSMKWSSPCHWRLHACFDHGVGEWHAAIAADLEPILLKYGVDMWNSGHVHDYESTWPIKNGNVTQTNYNEPKGIVHVTDGNGGVPGVGADYVITDCADAGKPWCRKHGTGGAYGRVIAHNATHMTYEHVQNVDGNVSDTWTIVQHNHGPFA